MKRLVLIFSLFPLTLSAAEIRVRVVQVIDGDTIRVIYGRDRVKIRLWAIDAPEKEQPFGVRAGEVLSSLISGRVVRIRTEGKDQFGVKLGVVYLGTTDINGEMVRLGWAWCYRRYARNDPRLLQNLIGREREAKKKRWGLWAGRNPFPPWEWRKMRRVN